MKKLSNNEIHDTYKGLWEIEESIKDYKKANSKPDLSFTGTLLNLFGDTSGDARFRKAHKKISFCQAIPEFAGKLFLFVLDQNYYMSKML